ncbi:hypothetical protein XH98_09490 [Bradyrhizobium sp. CCBAU 51745]|nr:hypothetical protein [Bradyrhizobium sp. CCBAU 45384]MDA9439346.1 hypothetical protein [Bradyrhizobium sp. CCBAU 51745]
MLWFFDVDQHHEQGGLARKAVAEVASLGGEAEFASTVAVMPGLVPGIHVLGAAGQDVDGRDEPGHDDAATAP